jgi:glycogen debranching enzyme
MNPFFKNFRYEPTENPDWGFARNVRAALLAPSAEWVQSVCSFQFEVNGKTFIAPNRDYPYEGLVTYHGGENWKFIDCIALSLRRRNGSQIPLRASNVKISPWRVDYLYYAQLPDSASADDEFPIVMSYSLDSENSPELPTGCIELHFPKGRAYDNDEVVPLIQPFIDIRHMYGTSVFEDYRIIDELETHGRIYISNGNRTLTFFSANNAGAMFGEPDVLNWHYKLGTGARTERVNPESGQSETVFEGERKDIAAFFGFQIPASSTQNSLRLFFATSLDHEPRKLFLPDLEKISEKSKRRDQSDLDHLVTTFPLPRETALREAIWGRIVTLTKFKTYSFFAGKYIRVPHAGAWWFKTAWYRDVFEALLNSFETLMSIPQERADMREIILSALSSQDKNLGLILNKIPEFTGLRAVHNSCDATLLCFIVANAYIEKTKDIDFALEVLACAGNALSSFKSNGKAGDTTYDSDGPPRVDKTRGLLLCSPHHSWIDTRTRSVDHAGQSLTNLPNRLSVKFIRKLYDHTSGKNVETISSSPCFFLPEINAQWITMLAGILQTIDLVNQSRGSDYFKDLEFEAEALLNNGRKHFKSVFWNESAGYLYNAVFEDGEVKDDIECEAGVTAAALLSESIFSHDELEAIWKCARSKLLIDRRLVKYGQEVLPFGIVVKNEDKRVFYGDHEYHSDTVWPRSTPYLIKLLRLLHEDQIIKDILINNLDHQMAECAIFYNQELFSRAFGNNAHPNVATSQNPVPVKNPIQLWSQWCDAYLETFGGREDQK